MRVDYAPTWVNYRAKMYTYQNRTRIEIQEYSVEGWKVVHTASLSGEDHEIRAEKYAQSILGQHKAEEVKVWYLT